jgi:hypothetical protein
MHPLPQPSPGFRSNIRRSSLLVLVVTAGLQACSEDDDGSTDTETNALDGACLWETNELLSEVDAPGADPTDCGVFLGAQPLENDCFSEGLEGDRGVQITINNCIDCMIHSTYVSTSAGKFHLYREADTYGDDQRVVRVDSCTDFVAGEGPGASCASPEVLYACSDPLPAPSAL